MKKLMMILTIVVMAGEVMAGVVFTPSRWVDPNYQFQVRGGVCNYQDYNEKYRTEEDIGVYVQTPAVEWDKAYLSFGWVQLIDNSERSGIEFALNTRVGYWWKGCPRLLDWELGGYWAVRAYNGLGFQIGLVNIRF